MEVTKKRLLFVTSNSGCGGINRALLNLVELLDHDKYDVSIMSMSRFGQYKDGFPNAQNIKADKWYNAFNKPLKKQRDFISVIGICRIINKFLKDKIRLSLEQRVISFIESEDFDVVIAFGEGAATNFVGKIKSQKKVAWLHCDYASYLKIIPSKMVEADMHNYTRFNKIVCVSKYTADVFESLVPNVSEKLMSVHNLMNSAEMKRLSNEFVPHMYDHDGFNIVTVGRIDTVKNQSIIPEAASLLKQNSIRFKWYVVGPIGTISEYDKLISLIRKYDVQDCVILLGEQTNPYPFIKNANLLVNTSISEACPYVINEAKILGTPIVCTNFGSAKEFIEPNVSGIITTHRKIGESILNLIQDKKLYNRLRNSVKNFVYDNKDIMSHIETIIDE